LVYIHSNLRLLDKTSAINYAEGCTSTTVEWEQWALAESEESEEEDEIEFTNFKIRRLLKIRKSLRIFKMRNIRILELCAHQCWPPTLVVKLNNTNTESVQAGRAIQKLKLHQLNLP